MKIFNKTDLLVLKHLRNDARLDMKEIAKRINLPHTTVYEKYKKLNKNIISRYVVLLDFKKFNNPIRAHIVINGKNPNLQEFLMNNINLNSLFKTTNGFDYYVDAIFRNMNEYNEFLESLIPFKLLKIESHIIIDEIIREKFLSEPEHVNYLI